MPPLPGPSAGRHDSRLLAVGGRDELVWGMASEVDAEDYIGAFLDRLKAHEAERVMGRPSALTPPKVRKFLEALERGNFRMPASAYAGLSYRTVRSWLEQGEKDDSGESIYADFLQAVEQAEAQWESAMVGTVTNAAKADSRFWMAGMLGLSRRHRERWAERTADELRQAQTPSIQVVIGIAPPGTPSNALPSTVTVTELPAQDATLLPAGEAR